MPAVLLPGLGLVHAADAVDPQHATKLDEVRVRAATVDSYRAISASSGALGDRPLLDTPFSIDAVTEELIKNRQANNLLDVFKGDASATPIGSGYTSETSTISVRGLQLDTLNGYHIDGLTVPAWATDLPVESFQQIELLKGLGGFMYGFGQPGGMLNFVTKQPTDRPLARFRVGYASRGDFTKEADVGGRFGANKQFGYRIDAVDEEGDTYVDGSHIKRDSVSLGLDWRITDALTWHVNGLYQKRRLKGALYGVIPCQDFGACLDPGTFVRVPSALSGGHRLGSRGTEYATSFKYAATGLAWQIAPDWKFTVDAATTRQDRSNRDSAIQVLDNRGYYQELQYQGYGAWLYRTAQAVLSGSFDTGPLHHEVVAGFNWMKTFERYDNQDPASAARVLGYGYLDDPGDFFVDRTPLDKHVRNQQVATQRAWFASDTLSFGEHWQALLGARSIHYVQDNYNYFSDGARNAHYDASPVTPTYALMYKPVANATVYASYVRSLEAGSSVPQGQGYANEGQSFPPLLSHQYELGAKLDGDRWSYTAAAFRIERGLVYDQVRDGRRYQVQNGTVRFDGIEFSAKGRIGEHWSLLGSGLWLDAKNLRADPALEGKRAYGAPRWQASAYLEYEVPRVAGLVFSAGGQYVGNRPLEADNSNIVKAYHTFDLGARYATHVGRTPVIYRVNLDNVTNQRYWLAAWQSILNQGAPRVLRASVEFEL